MRAFLATIKPVLHLPLGLCAAIIGVVIAIAIARANPHPRIEPSGWTVAAWRPSSLAGLPAEKLHPPPAIDWDAPEEGDHALGDEVAQARAYLVATAFTGGSMTILGKEKSIQCFHPQFAVNLAAAVREARGSGFPAVGVFSGCRPPGLGIGGFRDKFKSLHAYGLAADIHGIGGPGSKQAKLWHSIAAKHGVACVYGPYNRAEWNHCQGTRIKVAPAILRKTITASGPKDLDAMWRAASSMVLAAAGPVTALLASVQAPAPAVRAVHHKAKRAARLGYSRNARVARGARPRHDVYWRNDTRLARVDASKWDWQWGWR